MKTKRSFITILALLVLSATISNAQETEKGGITFAVIVGGNLNKFAGKDYDGDKIKDHKFIPGFHIGANIGIPIASNFYLQSGLQFVKKGSKLSDTSFIIGNYTSTYNPYYIEMPVKLIFKLPVGNGKLLLGVGPDIAYGLGGKWKRDAETINSYDVNGKIKFKNNIPSSPGLYDLYLKPIDVSVSILAGYQFSNNLFFHLNGQLGLTKINSSQKPGDPDDNTNIKNIGFGLSVGYRFGKK